MLLLLVLPRQLGSARSQDRRVPKRKAFQGPQQIQKNPPSFLHKAQLQTRRNSEVCAGLGLSEECFGSERGVCSLQERSKGSMWQELNINNPVLQGTTPREGLSPGEAVLEQSLCAPLQPEKGLELPCSLSFTQKSPEAFPWLPSQPGLSLDSPFCGKGSVRAKAAQPPPPPCPALLPLTAQFHCGKENPKLLPPPKHLRNTCSW